MKITWADFKRIVESQGLKNDMVLDAIDWDDIHRSIEVIIDPGIPVRIVGSMSE